MVREAAILALAILCGCSRSQDEPSKTNADNKLAPSNSTVATPQQKPEVVPAEFAKECDFADCAAGTKVITSPVSAGPYFACKSEQLSEYTNFVLGLLSVQKTLAGTMPNVDPETGEPVYEGETKQVLDGLRLKAGVETFDEAVALCTKGPHRRKATVLNFVKGRSATWISDDKSGVTYWVPTNEIEIGKH
jgi:hypothetical protein